MKKTILLFSVFLFAFSDNSVKLKKDKVDETKAIINQVYQYVDKSNIPHQDALSLEAALKTAYTNLSDTAK